MGSAAFIEAVTRDSKLVLRQLPEAHRRWQAPYRNWRFRRAISRLDALLWDLTVDHLSDADLGIVEELVDAVEKVIQLHLSRLGDSMDDHLDRDYFIGVVRRFAVMREGLSQGFSPNPANRPTREQLLDELASGLRQANVA